MGIKVLIVGKGLTGLVAAWQLLEKSDKKEIEIEIVSDGAGASPYVHGFNVPLHPKDTVEIFKEDTLWRQCNDSRHAGNLTGFSGEERRSV